MFVPQRGSNKYQASIRRSRLDIKLDVLRAIRQGVRKPTRIMYASNLSWNKLQTILGSLVSADFINEFKEQGDNRTLKYYEINQKGLNILRYVDNGTDLLTLMKSSQSA